jgi:hypothetical protein
VVTGIERLFRLAQVPFGADRAEHIGQAYLARS